MAFEGTRMFDYKNDYPLPPRTALGSIHLRFLKLLRGTGNNVAEGELFVSKEKEENYEAVSWCWGGQAPTAPMRILDKSGEPTSTLRIPPNLEAALKSLRYEQKPRVLWIDAICINQSNFEERSEQVPLMAQIYGQATNVFVWLGEGSADTTKAINFIKQRVLKLESFDKLVQDRSTASDWVAVNKLMKKAWFSRLMGCARDCTC